MTVITVIGAGSASFGENTLSAILHSDKLKGSTLRLVDHNQKSLEIVHRLSQRLNREWDSRFQISTHMHHEQALEGADFVVSAIEVGPREELWRSDFEIPIKFGVRQPYAENGGPGGFIHAARNIGPVMQIVGRMEQVCPDAWFINFTNPMTRICDAINRHSRIKVVGLCHQVYTAYCFVGMVLSKELGIQVPQGISGMQADILEHPLRWQVIHQTLPLVDLRAAGINHFSWVLSMHDQRTGQDLYPIFRERFADLDPGFEPLTREVFNIFGLFPVPGDTHLSEYLPWLGDPISKPWEKYGIRLYDWEMMAGLRDFSLDRLEEMAEGRMTVAALLETDSEGALEMIVNIACGGNHLHPAANLPNEGQITNLPIGGIVETPVQVQAAGIQPLHVGSLPDPIAELCRRELALGQLCVDSAVTGSHQKALQCLLLDPLIRDSDSARNILDEYLLTYRQHLPQYWK